MYFTNMYDIFPNEMNQLFTGMISDNPTQHMPRVICGGTFPSCRDPRIVYMDFYRGDCSTPGSTSCRPHPADVTYRPNDAERFYILNNRSTALQNYAAIYGLSQFPVYYDTSFQTQLFLCVEGSGDCNAAEGIEGTDFVRYTSDRFGKSYLAWQLTPGQGGLINQESIAFAMVREARDSTLILRALRAFRGDFGGPANSEENIAANLSPEEFALYTSLSYVIPTTATTRNNEIDRLDFRVRDLESFFGYLTQLEREFGINIPLPYPRPEI